MIFISIGVFPFCRYLSLQLYPQFTSTHNMIKTKTMRYFKFWMIAGLCSFTSAAYSQNPFGLPGDTSTTRDIYGYDSRREAKTYDYNGYTQAVLTAMPTSWFYEGDKINGYSLRQNLKNQFKADVDPAIRFLDQPTLGGCTGFLIAPDIMITAGHCISSDEHEITNDVVVVHKAYYDEVGKIDGKVNSWVFDYNNDIQKQAYNTEKYGDIFVASIPTSNQYRVKKVLKSVLNDALNVDYAVLQLDRPTNRDPFLFRTNLSVAKGDNLAMIGSPYGLPLKLSDGAKVTQNSGATWFGTNLDAFGGNSGGPVYNKAGFGWIEGILVRGRIDKDNRKGYHLDKETNLVKETRFSDTDAENFLDDYGLAIDLMSTEVQRITVLPVNVMVRAVYNNYAYAINNNDQKRFDKWSIYTWIYNMDNQSFITAELGADDPLAILAIKKGRTEMFKAFVEAGYDFSREYPGIGNAFVNAIKYQNKDALAVMLQEGYDLEQRDANGNTAIFHCLSYSTQWAVAELIKNGANINALNRGGDTPLHIAIESHNLSLVQQLVENGANVHFAGSKGHDAYNLSKKVKAKEIKKYLKKIR